MSGDDQRRELYRRRCVVNKLPWLRGCVGYPGLYGPSRVWNWNERKCSGMCTCSQRRDTCEMSHANCEPVNDDVNPWRCRVSGPPLWCDHLLLNQFILIPISSFLIRSLPVHRALTKCGARVERYEQRRCGQVEIVA